MRTSKSAGEPSSANGTRAFRTRDKIASIERGLVYQMTEYVGADWLVFPRDRSHWRTQKAGRSAEYRIRDHQITAIQSSPRALVEHCYWLMSTFRYADWTAFVNVLLPFF